MDEKNNFTAALLLLFVTLFLFVFLSFVSALPNTADSIVVEANETKGVGTGLLFNLTGGRLATINISASTQNPRWKGFVGQVSGSFTLDDSTGSTVFDWALATVSGEVYAARNQTSLAWTSIKCANTTLLEAENVLMDHTSSDDNITKTFNNATHAEFFVGDVNISVNSCPTLNTYQLNATQDDVFEEIALTDSTIENITAGNMIYATIFFFNTYKDLIVFLIITLPLIIIGVLFYLHRKKSKIAKN